MTPTEIFEMMAACPITRQELMDAYNVEYPDNDSSRLFSPDGIAIWVGTAEAILKRVNELPEQERLGAVAADMAAAFIAGIMVLNNRTSSKCCGGSSCCGV